MSCMLDYPRDDLRYKYFIKESSEHQAKMELRTFQWLVRRLTKPGDTILDPMSGVGTVHFANFMGRHTVAVELVPRFVELQRKNVEYMTRLWSGQRLWPDMTGFYIPDMEWDTKLRPGQDQIGVAHILEGDCRRWLPYSSPVDAVIFSPPYGSLWSFSSKERANKVNVEKNYVVGYDDSEANVGNLQNYTNYLTAMRIIYRKCWESLKVGGYLATVVKDYIDKGQRVLCSRDNLRCCVEAGFTFHEWHFRRADIQNNPYSARNKANRIAAGKHTADLDIGREDIIVVRKGGI